MIKINSNNIINITFVNGANISDIKQTTGRKCKQILNNYTILYDAHMISLFNYDSCSGSDFAALSDQLTEAFEVISDF